MPAVSRLPCVVWLLAALSAQQPAAATFSERALALHRRIGPDGFLLAEHVQALEALLAEMPAALTADEQGAFGMLFSRLGKRALEAESAAAWQPRLVACCERLVRPGTLLDSTTACVWLAAGEAYFVVEDSDAAVAAFHRAVEFATRVTGERPRDWRERTVAHAHERAFRVELSRQRLRAAKAELASAQLEQVAARRLAAAELANPAARERARIDAESFLARHELAEAHLALRIGLFDSCARRLARCQELLEQQPPQELEHERDQAVLVAMELALLREDHALVGELAASLLARGIGNELVVERARLRAQQARIATGQPVSLVELQRLFKSASPLNRPSIALDLVAYAVRSGDDEAASKTATELLAGRALRDPGVGLWTLLTVAYHELRPERMPAVDSPRWQQWETALADAWQQLIAEWHGTAVEAESLAFLQMEVRRDVLAFWMRTRLLAPGGERACVQRYLEADASGSTARRLQTPRFAIDEVMTTLVPTDGALLVFLPAAAGSHALYLAHDGVHVEALPPEGRLRERVFALRRAVAAADAAAATALLRDQGASLAAQLLPPSLQARLRGKRHVLVAGYELLHSLPVEWLPLADGSFCGVRHAVTYLPSIALAMHLAQRPREPFASRAVLLAGTEVAVADRERWGKEPVRTTAAELLRALAAIAPEATELRLAATRADLLEVSRAELQAVVTHGIFDGTRPCPAGLLLAAGQQHDTGAVFATDLPTAGAPRIAYLGVCGASRSALRLGEDGGHRLTTAWLVAGTDAVVATDFDIRLDEVLQLLTPFAAALVEGASVAEALWHARQQAAAAGAHPRVWGGMRVEGLPGTTVSLPAAPPTPSSWRWLAAGLVALVVAGATIVCGRLRLRAAR